jgi:Zn-dependent M32 family carboxypeptidase
MVKPLPTGIFMVYYGHSSSLPSRHTAKDPSDLMSSSVRKADEATQNTEWKKRTIKAIRREGEKAKEAARAAARTYPHQTTTSKGTIWRIRTREHHTWIFDHEPTRWERFSKSSGPRELQE